MRKVLAKKVLLRAVVASLSMGMLGCSSEPIQSVCNDAPKFEQAISRVSAENAEFKAELLEDVAEYAADTGRCPDYAGQGEEDE